MTCLMNANTQLHTYTRTQAIKHTHKCDYTHAHTHTCDYTNTYALTRPRLSGSFTSMLWPHCLIASYCLSIYLSVFIPVCLSIYLALLLTRSTQSLSFSLGPLHKHKHRLSFP